MLVDRPTMAASIQDLTLQFGRFCRNACRDYLPAARHLTAILEEVLNSVKILLDILPDIFGLWKMFDLCCQELFWSFVSGVGVATPS